MRPLTWVCIIGYKTGLEQTKLCKTITQSTMRTFLAPVLFAANAATAALLWRQKPIACFTPAWCPGGLTCLPVVTISIVQFASQCTVQNEKTEDTRISAQYHCKAILNTPRYYQTSKISTESCCKFGGTCWVSICISIRSEVTANWVIKSIVILLHKNVKICLECINYNQNS